MSVFQCCFRGVKGLLLLGMGLFVGCDYNKIDPPAFLEKQIPLTTMQIATLRTLYTGVPLYLVGKSSVVVSGTVTSSDRDGNFYRSFFLEDETGAVEIRAGLYDLHRIYPLGAWVSVRADSLTLGVDNGTLQLGLASDSYPTDYMGHRVIIDRHLFLHDRREEPVARLVQLSRLREEWLGTLVHCRGVWIDGHADTTWAIGRHQIGEGTPQSASLKFRDASQDSLYVTTSGYAAFADEKVPQGSLALTGILLQGKVNGKMVYQLKLRDLKDVEEL